MTFALPPGPAMAERDELAFGAAVIIIDLTDNDIDLQVSDPIGREVFTLNARGICADRGN